MSVTTSSAWGTQTRAFGRLLLYQGDITQLDTTAIVNAANSTILGGGGVDGAIHKAGGPAIVEECRQIRVQRYPDGLPIGEAVLTNAGELPSQKVIHTVGPIWHGATSRNPNCWPVATVPACS
nr:macro domain-containing protein [Hymenobacter cellulosilyticus]